MLRPHSAAEITTMETQKTSWGKVEWFETADEHRSLSSGIVTLDPYKKQEMHVHYESEQFVYILQGRGRVVVNGEIRDFGPGSAIHMPANCRNSFENTGDEPVRHILVAAPPPQYRDAQEASAMPLSSADFSNAAETIRSYIKTSCSLPAAIFSKSGELLIKNDNYPDFCNRHCRAAEKSVICPCMNMRFAGEPCPYGLTVLHVPVIAGGRLLGTIVSGHVLLGKAEEKSNVSSYDAPVATIIAIRRWMDELSTTLISMARVLRGTEHDKTRIIPLPGGELKTTSEITNKAVVWINEHYREDIQLKDFAMENYLAESSLARSFKNAAGETFMSYVHRVRISHAEDLMIYSDISVKEISALCGYKSLNNFYRHFCSFTGMTPAEYRKNK